MLRWQLLKTGRTTLAYRIRRQAQARAAFTASGAGVFTHRRGLPGDGSAEPRDGGTIEIELSFDNCDDAILTGRRA
jgi:hypothetical protein